MQQRDSIARVLITQKFQKGENIVNEGEQASSFYIIKDVKYLKKIKNNNFLNDYILKIIKKGHSVYH